jgi:hypothetical protein
MRLHYAACVAVLIAPALVTAQENLGPYEDRIAVEDVMARYVWAVDSLDAAAAMGRSEDRLVKRNGRWLIQFRKLTVFTD